MKFKNKIQILLSIFLLIPFITACSTNNTPKDLYVIPTEYGTQCLKNSTIKEAKRKPIWNNGTRYLADNAYEMTIYSTPEDKVHEEGSAFLDSDIDVQLFGIGTNKSNSYSADTVLYATTNEKVANGEKIEETSDLVTGVEYAYQTGPIRNDLGERQEIWIKTTAMEAKNGYYVESSSYTPTYTQVFLTIVDGIPPEEFNDSINVSKRFIVENKDNLEERLKEFLNNKVVEYFQDQQYSDFNDKSICSYIDNIRFDNFDKDAKTFTGLMDLYDLAGNSTKDQKFTINVVLDDPENNFEVPENLLIGEGEPFSYTSSLEYISEWLKGRLAMTNSYFSRGSDYSFKLKSNLKLYNGENIDELREFIDTNKPQEVFADIYYKDLLIEENTKIAEILFTDDVYPEIIKKPNLDAYKIMETINPKTVEDLYKLIDYVNKGEYKDEFFNDEVYYKLCAEYIISDDRIYITIYLVDRNKNENPKKLFIYSHLASSFPELSKVLEKEKDIIKVYLTKEKEIVNL